MTEGSFISQARVPLPDPLGVAQAMCAHFEEHGDVTHNPAGGIVRGEFGSAEVRAEGRYLHMKAESFDETSLYVVKSALAEHLVEFAGDHAPAFTWTGKAIDAAIPFFREMRVIEARNITPHMRRITLQGDAAHFDSDSGMHVRLLFPPRGRAPVWPYAAPDGRTIWAKGEDALIRRVYTIRSINPARGTLDIDMVLHEDNHAPGSTWAATVQPGDAVGVMGPGGGMPPEADWYVLAGDETALPVIARIAETAPNNQQIIAFIEVSDRNEEQTIASPANLSPVWLHRNGAHHGTTDLLETALRGMDWPSEGNGYVLVGCEHRAARAIRRYLTGERAMARKSVNVAAYWRLGRDGDGAMEQDRD